MKILVGMVVFMLTDNLTLYEVSIVTRGERLERSLINLVQHAYYKPFKIHIVSTLLPNNLEVTYLIETLKQLGCKIIFSIVSSGIGLARYTTLHNIESQTVISLDDDVIVTPFNAFEKLANAAIEHGYSSPLIRNAQGLVSKDGLTNHVENWKKFDTEDPLIINMQNKFGKGWIRNYQTDKDEEIDDLSGWCFCASKELADKAADNILKNWKNVGFEDVYIARQNDKNGIRLNDVNAYHYGHHTTSKWIDHTTVSKIMDILSEEDKLKIFNTNN